MDIIFDCRFGVSGDMIVGALLDLGADEKKLKSFLHCLVLDDFEIVVSKIKKGNIYCTDFDVKLSENNLDHDMQYLYGDKKVDLKIKTERKIDDIEKIVKNCKLSEKYKKIALKIFKIIANAESKAHKIPAEDVVFHESSAMDSIIDILSIAFCLEDLKVNNVYVKNLVEGSGFINCRMGKLPIPTPAVKNIVEEFGIILDKSDLPYELVTPTGIAALAVIAKFQEIKGDSKKVGYGSGKRDYGTLGVIKVEII